MSTIRRIAIQSGHWNMTSGATGAPQEQVRTLAIGLKLVDLLRANGFEVYHTDSFADDNPKVTNQDWDLFLALHCDANYAGDEGGGFVDYPTEKNPDGSIQDGNNKESKRIKEVIEDVYFSESGIKNVPARSNPNTKFYYMWNYLSLRTACNIIEMGESIDPHDNVILNDVPRVANALLHGIQKAFGVQTQPTPPPPTPPTPPTDPCKVYKDDLIVKDRTISDRNDTILELTNDLKLANDKISSFQTELIDKLAIKDKECQKLIEEIRQKVKIFASSI